MSNLELASIVSVGSQQVACDLEGESVVLHLENGQYYGLDDIGTRIWALMEKPIQVEELVKKLREEFEVSQAECSAHVLEFLEDLHSHKMIEVGHEKSA